MRQALSSFFITQHGFKVPLIKHGFKDRNFKTILGKTVLQHNGFHSRLC